MKNLFEKSKDKLLSTTKATAETVGQVAGNTISGTAKGLYKGVTGHTDESLEMKRQANQLRMRIATKERSIMNWAWMLFVGSICVMTLLFIGDNGFSANSLQNVLSDRWVVYLIPLVLFILISAFSRKIAEETTN